MKETAIAFGDAVVFAQNSLTDFYDSTRVQAMLVGMRMAMLMLVLMRMVAMRVTMIVVMAVGFMLVMMVMTLAFRMMMVLIVVRGMNPNRVLSR